MNDVPENELFSAYLDGELTAAEQADVERLLARSPAARQLLEELRALSSTLQAMPQYKLGEDITQRVLRMAERQILTGEDQFPKPAAAPWQSLRRRLLNPRALVWSAAAVAVAVTLVVIESKQPPQPADGRRVAMVTENGEEAAPAASIGAASGSREERRKDLADDKSDAAEQAELAKPTQPGEAAGKKVVNGKFAEPTFMTKSAGRALRGKAESVREVEPGSAPRADKSVPEKPTAKGLVMEKPSGEEVTATLPPNAPAVAPPSAAPGSGRAPKGSDRPELKLGDVDGFGGIADSGQGRGGRFEQAAASVVVLDCSPQAAQEKAFNKVLVANGLAWDQTQVHAKDTGYVVATPKQIEATLADLHAQRQNFLALSVQPAPGVESWKRYSRAAEKQQQVEGDVETRGPGAGAEDRQGKPDQRELKSKTPGPVPRTAPGKSDADRLARSLAPADRPDQIVAKSTLEQDTQRSASIKQAPLSRQSSGDARMRYSEQSKKPKAGVEKPSTATEPKPPKGLPQGEPQQPAGAQHATQGAEKPEGRTYDQQRAGWQNEQQPRRKSEQKHESKRTKQQKQAQKYRVLFVLRVVPPHISNIPSAAEAARAADVPNAAVPPAALMDIQTKPTTSPNAPAPNVAPVIKK